MPRGTRGQISGNDEGGRYFACRYCGKYRESAAAIMRYRD